MLDVINKIYLLSGIILFTTLVGKVESGYYLIYFYAFFTFLSYFAILYINTNMKESNYNTSLLIGEVFFYTAFFVILNNYISYVYNKDFFVFSAADAKFYHTQTSLLIHMPLKDAINYYLDFMGFDDLGIILVLYPLYLIEPSNLMLNFFYIFVGLITALSIYNISLNFISNRYAFLAALAYSLSSFTIFYHSTGLKESFMIMLIVLTFDFYYRFLNSRKLLDIFIIVALLASLFLFRPAISILIVAAIGLGSIISKEGNVALKIFAFILIVILFFMKNYLSSIVESYTTGSVENLISAKESKGAIKGGVLFAYAVNIFSQAFGPLPTFAPTSSKILTTFYSAGLLYRVLLGVPFWLGVYYAFVGKRSKLYPIFLFALFEMVSLIFILDGLELRKAMPHMPFVYITSFWFLDKYDNKIIKIKKVKFFRSFFYSFIIILIILIFYWNFR